MPEIFSTMYTSSSWDYLDFLDQFHSRKVDIGSMYKDRLKYTQDIKRVHKDYKKATVQLKGKMLEASE
jgi:hypothetical protein